MHMLLMEWELCTNVKPFKFSLLCKSSVQIRKLEAYANCKLYVDTCFGGISNFNVGKKAN